MPGIGGIVRELVQARGSSLKRYAFLLCGDDDRADDLVQEAMVRVLSRRHPRDLGELERYVRRVLVNLVIDEGRRTTRWDRLQPAVAASFDRVCSQSAEDETCDRMWIRDMLSSLPPRQRAAVVLRYFEDLPVAGIADALGCSQGTVKSQLHDALRRLAALNREGAGANASEGASPELIARPEQNGALS
ncbi:RNA polymerase sigma factor [Yinghuangia aomiensis]